MVAVTSSLPATTIVYTRARSSMDTTFFASSAESKRTVPSTVEVLKSSSTLFPSRDRSKFTSMNVSQGTTQNVSDTTVAITSALLKSITSSVTLLTPVTTSSITVSLAHSSARSTVISSASPSSSNVSVVMPKSTPRIHPSSSSLLTITISESLSATESRRISLHSSEDLLTTNIYISTRTVELSSPSLQVTKTSVTSSIVETIESQSLIHSTKSSRIFIGPSVSVSSSVIFAVSSTHAVMPSPSSVKSVSGRISRKSTTGLLSTETFISSRRVTPVSSLITVSTRSMVTLLLPSSDTSHEPSSVSVASSLPLFGGTSVYSTVKKPSTTIVLPPATSLVRVKSSSIDLRSSSLKTSIMSSTVRDVITSREVLKPTSVTLTLVKVPHVSSLIISTTVSTDQLSPSTLKDISTVTPTRSSSSSKTSSVVSATTGPPTEPVRPTANTNSSEGLVGIQLLVPETEDEGLASFRGVIEFRLAEAYRLGQEKGSERKKRDLMWFEQKHWRTAPVNLDTTLEFASRKRIGSYEVHEKRGRRFRRQEDNITVLVRNKHIILFQFLQYSNTALT